MTAVQLPLLELESSIRLRQVGILLACKATEQISLPLAKVDISARVADRIAEVTMKETFKNNLKEHLEAVYTFPLPGGGAVTSFEMRVGSRIVRGQVQERSAARRNYQQALEEGKRAALLEQERDDVFTVQVGNLPPGEEVTVLISYCERLPFFDDGTTELRLPMVVAPRYIPGSALERSSVGEGIEADTDLVPDASRISPPRLAEGFDAKVALSLEVELMKQGRSKQNEEIEDLSCSQHALRTRLSSGSVKVTLARTDELMNRDFVLRWSVADKELRSTLLSYTDQEGNKYGMLSIVAPRREGFLGIGRDIVFVVDRSGSMEGIKMVSAAKACSILLSTLSPRDSFAIAAFDDRIEWMPAEGGYFVAASEAGIEKGEKFLRQITARGGTEMDQALGGAIRAIKEQSSREKRIPIIVLLTDGQVGNESQILKRIQTEIGDARAFTVGIDTAVNQSFLQRLANLGGGTATFVTPGTALEEALRAVGQEIGSPLLVNISVEGVLNSSTAPAAIPDLFIGRTTTIFMKLVNSSVEIRGLMAGGSSFETRAEASAIDLSSIGQLWAKRRIVDLEDRYRVEPYNQAAIKQEIIELSLKHKVLTRFTAFIAIDEAEVVNRDGERKRMVQPVEMPAEWEMAAPMEAASLGSTGSFMLPTTASAAPPQSFEMMDASESFRLAAPCPPPTAAPVSKPKAAMRKQSAPIPEPEQERSCATPGSAPSGVSGIFKAIGKILNPKRERAEKASEAARSTKDPYTEIRQALKAFQKVFQEATEQLRAGKVPKAASLEEARSKLLKLVSESSIGTQLPLLQKLLRSTAVEIVAALSSPAISSQSLLTMFEQQKRSFEQAYSEAEKVMGGSDQPFWESTI